MRQHKWQIQACCALTGEGYVNSLDRTNKAANADHYPPRGPIMGKDLPRITRRRTTKPLVDSVAIRGLSARLQMHYVLFYERGSRVKIVNIGVFYLCKHHA